LGAMRAIGLALDFEDDGSFYETVEEGHGDGAVGQIVSRGSAKGARDRVGCGLRPTSYRDARHGDFS
jgi:hypothetical protein